MHTIHKHHLKIEGQQTIFLRRGAKILYLAMNCDMPTIWSIADSKDLEPVTFNTYGTGHEFDGTAGTYIGTYQYVIGEDQPLVFHVFKADKADQPAEPQEDPK